MNQQNTKAAAYWAAVGKVHATLRHTEKITDELGIETEVELAYPVYITSIGDSLRAIRGGVVVDALPKVAAQRIVEKTHRLATEDEIKKYHDAGNVEARRCEREEQNRRRTFTSQMPGEMQQTADLVAAAVREVVQAGGSKPIK